MDRREKEIWVKAYIMGRLNEKAINSNIVEGDGFLEKHELEDYFRSLHYGNNILENMDEKKLNALVVSVLDAVDHLSNDHIEKIHGECYYQWDYDWDKSWHLADYGGKDLEKYFNQEDIIQDDDVPGYPDEYSDGDLKHRNYLFQHLEDSVEEYFEPGFSTPYMLYSQTSITKRIPAITHKDFSCRIQTVNDDQNPRLCQLLRKLDIPVLLNTSFNMSGEPIIETPEDAIASFKKMDIDLLVIGNYLVSKWN